MFSHFPLLKHSFLKKTYNKRWLLSEMSIKEFLFYLIFRILESAENGKLIKEIPVPKEKILNSDLCNKKSVLLLKEYTLSMLEKMLIFIIHQTILMYHGYQVLKDINITCHFKIQIHVRRNLLCIVKIHLSSDWRLKYMY